MNDGHSMTNYVAPQADWRKLHEHGKMELEGGFVEPRAMLFWSAFKLEQQRQRQRQQQQNMKKQFTCNCPFAL